MSPVKEIQVQKRDGTLEPLDLEKFHRVVEFACEGLSGVSASEVEIRSHIKFYNKIKTSDIQELLIRSAADLISVEAPNYQYVASRLINYHLRKQVFGSIDPPSLLEQIKRGLQEGLYDPSLLVWYSEEEIAQLDRMIRHKRDYDIAFVGMEQFRGKYLVKNRVTNKIIETPQFAMMLISMVLFANEEKSTRLEWVARYYNALSGFYLSLPTPIMAGVRTAQRQFSSCVLIESGDSLDSIYTTAHAIGRYVAQKAGIGIGAGALRPVGSEVRNGDTATTGVIPYFKLWERAVKSCSQGGVRGGSATLYYPIWHMEVEDLLVLKNNKGTENNRARQLDYGVQLSRLFYKRLIEGGNITLMNQRDVPGLYEAFFKGDQTEFERLYLAAEKNSKVRKKVVPAVQLFSALQKERKDTGRIYIMNVDNANRQSSFIDSVAPIRMSNLCTEINLPTAPLSNINDEDGEIALCILSATNMGKIDRPEDFEEVAMLAVRALDNLIDLQSYPVKAAEISTRNRRSLGIGVINFAYWLAEKGLNYQNITEEGLKIIDEYVEAWSYYLIKASADLAVERGACGWFNQTKYSQGLFPHDNRAPGVDQLVPHSPKRDWEALKAQIAEHGIRNSTLMALMPAETSAQVSNSTNGFEPIRALAATKKSKDGVLTQIAPHAKRLKKVYDPVWDQRSPRGYLKIAAVFQKYMDQGISTNTSYNPKFYPGEQLPMQTLLEDLLFFYTTGGKQLYYFNTDDGSGEIDVDAKPAMERSNQEPPMIDQDGEDCESCKI